MFTEIQFSQTSPNNLVNRLTDDPDNLRIFNTLIRDVFSEQSGIAAEPEFAAVSAFMENHEKIYSDGTDVDHVGGNAIRRIFDLGRWALGEEDVLYDQRDYLFLQNFAATETEDSPFDILSEVTSLYNLDNFRATLLDLCNERSRTYRQILSGDRCYSEDVFYKVNKYAVSPEGVRENQAIQSTYLINNSHNREIVNLIDTQLKYMGTYEYEIMTYRVVIGTKTKLADVQYFEQVGAELSETGEVLVVNGYFRDLVPVEVDPTAPASLDPPLISFDVDSTTLLPLCITQATAVLQPSIQLIELPYVSSTTRGINVLRGTVLDDPPMPPEIEVVPYRGVNNRLLFLLNTGAGSREFEPIAFRNSEQMYINRLRTMNVDPNKTTILYENDDPSVQFEIYRLDRKPSSYDDFKERILSYVDTRDALIDFKYSSSTSYRDEIVPNKKYYYMFRAIDIHGHYSYPSPVYEIELVDNDGAVYPIINVIELEARRRRKSKTKDLNRFMKIAPSFLQSVLNAQELEDGPPDSAPESDELPIGVQDISLWGRSYKFRLTSKKTGRKIDLNIKFKKEYDKTRPERPKITILQDPTDIEPPTTERTTQRGPLVAAEGVGR